MWQMTPRVITNVAALAGGSVSFQTSFDAGVALSANSANWNGFNLRALIPATALSTSGTQVRVTLKAGSTEGAAVDNCFIGQQAAAGDAWDMEAGTPTRIQSGGSDSFTVSVGSTLVLDATVFTLDETKNHILAFHFNSAANDVLATGSVSGCAYYHKSAADETGTANVSGYTTVGGNACIFVQKVEVA